METGWVQTGSPEGFPEWAGQMPALPQVPSPRSCGCLLNAGSMLGWRLQPLGGRCCLSAMALRASRVIILHLQGFLLSPPPALLASVLPASKPCMHLKTSKLSKCPTAFPTWPTYTASINEKRKYTKT